MKKLLILLLATGALKADEPKICVKCQKVRKWHAENPNPYTHYEDWLAHKEELEKNPFLEDKAEPEDEISFEN